VPPPLKSETRTVHRSFLPESLSTLIFFSSVHHPDPPPMGGEQDHSGSLSGGDDVEPNKKRKVPASLVTAESDRSGDSTRDAPKAARRRQSAVYNAHLFHKALFLQRKASFLTLFTDATHAVKAGAKAEHVAFPELAVLERLLLSLQYVGVGDWLPDKSSWRSGPSLWGEMAQGI
jgi:hypothetical protein